MKFRLPTITNPFRLAFGKRGSFGVRLSGLLACLFCMSVHAANVTVSGLDDVVKGKVYAQVLVDEPTKEVRIEIPGVTSRTERQAPFGLMSDQGGKLNPWDTSAHANGDYLLTVVAVLEDGSEVREQFPFRIDNPIVKVDTKTISIALNKVPGRVYVGQQLTIQTTGLSDGEVVWFHLFDKNWGNLVRKNLKVKNDSVTFKIPDVSGERRLQLQVDSRYKKTVAIQVLAAPELPKVEPTPVPAPEPTQSPEPQPTPADPEPTPEPEPAPQPEPAKPAISINLSTAPSSLKVGQKISVKVIGINDGETLYYHVFNRNWGDLVRSNVTVQGGEVDLVIPNVSGNRILQLQYGQKSKASKNVIVSPADPVEVPQPNDPTPDPAPVATPGNAPTLTPGGGFNGVTPQPAAVGNRTTNTMARWDVVPFQRFDGVFEVGVVAHHSYGMDRVAFSFNGGPWRSVSAPSVNPRTGVTEYWAKIDAKSIKDGKVELRAVAYPKNGKPRVLEPLFLWANAGGSIKFPVYELGAGSHNLPSNLQSPSDKWLIVRPKPGVRTQDVTVWGMRQTSAVNLKIENVKMRGGAGNQGAGKGGRLWIDNVNYTGQASNFKSNAQLTWWIADHNWRTKYFTDMTIDHIQTAFHSGTGIIRNCHVKTVYEDVVRQNGLIVNVKVDKVVAGVPGYVFHPDVFQWYFQNPKNMIVQDFEVKEAGAQGLYPNTTLTDCAFINVDLNINISNRPLQLQDATTNVLIKDSEMISKIDGILRWDKSFKPKDIVIRDSTIGAKHPYLPAGWQHSEIRVYPLMYD